MLSTTKTHARWLLASTLTTLLLVACGASQPASPSAGPATATVAPPAPPTAAATPPQASAVPTPSGPVLRMVAFGDSWPEGAHCNGCRPFPLLWADGLKTLSGMPVEVTDLTGSHEPSLAESKGTRSLLQAITTSQRTRDAIAAADVILIATGPNEIGPRIDAIKAGTCGGSDGLECIRDLDVDWRANFEAILTEIEALRAGKPTVIRMVNAANTFLSVPEMSEGLPADFATTTAEMIADLLEQAICDAASSHDAVCVDVRPIVNGPTEDKPGNEDSPAVMQAVADALLATGIDELD